MRAVIGTVTSSKPISLSKAASILSRFSSAGAGAPRDVAAYLHRASSAFGDLVEFHRQLREECRSVDAGGEEEEHKKKIKNPVPTREIEANGVVDEKNKSKKKMKRERELEAVGNGDGKKKKRKHSNSEERGAEEAGIEARERKKKRKKIAAEN